MKIRDVVSLGSLKQIATNPSHLLRLPRYMRDFAQYRKASPQKSPVRLYPCLGDAQPTQSTFDYYFYQDTWAAKQVFRQSPDWLVDIGSTVLLVGILSQFRRCVSIDVRPIDSKLDGLEARKGTATNLPFKDGEVPCITTMCVLEHVGLGRYGDEIDPLGTEKAAAEIRRVIRPGGLVVYSLPVGREVLEFNANRRFTIPQARALFEGWDLLDSCLLSPDPRPLPPDEIDPESFEAVACFAFRKPI